MSLLISLTHYWEDDEIKTDVNIYLSKDKHHDTNYFQRAFEEHAQKYAKYLAKDELHYVFTGMLTACTLSLSFTLTLTTDGAPSHFKNRFSLTFLLKFSSTVVWGFNAPSHGKGPWYVPYPFTLQYTHTSIHRDGLGAVIKNMLRRMELNKDFPGHVYMDTVEDAFFFLAKHYSRIDSEGKTDWYGEQRKRLHESVSDIKFHLFKTPVEDMDEGVAQHWLDGGKYNVESKKVM